MKNASLHIEDYSDVKFGDQKCMIAGVFPSPWLAVNPAIHTCIGQYVGHHNVVQAPADISFKSIRDSIVPECVVPGFRMPLPEYIDKSPLHNIGKGILDRLTKTDMPP